MNSVVNKIVFASIFTLSMLGTSRAEVEEDKIDIGDLNYVSSHQKMFEDGRKIFRFDSFGSEAFWGNQLRLHDAIKGEQNGGVGPGVSPKTALSVGLKVDVAKLDRIMIDAIREGRGLDDPDTTLALLKKNAVVGLKGVFKNNKLTSIGITCALCHSTVNNSFAPGIGQRLDGWPNRDLNVGAIVNLAPNKAPLAQVLGVDEETVSRVLTSWGPGRYDAILLMDGKAFRPDGKTGATLLPAAFGLAGVNLHTYNGWGSVPYWNAYVAVTQMHGQGTFYDPRLNDPIKYPLAVRNNFWNVRAKKDLVSSKLPALHIYQLGLRAPTPSKSTYDQRKAKRGKILFEGKAQCIACHVPPLYTEPGWNMHTGAEIGIDDFQALRSPDERYRTTPLKGLFTRKKGGFYHDGRFPTYRSVVEHYNEVKNLNLDEDEKVDLTEYLKSF
ncbi:hypothetical protein ACJVC5_00190 [Peredibacter sp. HCB2-198]|uniref:hypothetical protein n=1 Tax=Peredibacter sp. HCB2-198 TaxID=3383025 RepID=UPI0038B6242B